MQISRDADGLRFLGECAPEKGFVSGDILCAGCGRRIDPQVDSRDISLVCTGCGYAYPVRDDIPVLLVDEARKPTS